MPLIQLFDKWLLEHGSATLSKEVIADLRGKITASDSAHAKEMQELKAAQTREIASLNERHAVEMAYLERKIAELQKPQQPVEPQFSDKEIAVFKILASAEDSASDQELERLLNLPKAVISFCLQNLDNAGYAESGVYQPNRGNIWRLTSNGNAYAVRNDFVGPHPPNLPRRRQGFMRG